MNPYWMLSNSDRDVVKGHATASELLVWIPMKNVLLYFSGHFRIGPLLSIGILSWILIFIFSLYSPTVSLFNFPISAF